MSHSRQRLGWPSLAALLGLCMLSPPAVAGLHERGTLTLSLGGSLSHTTTYDRRSLYTFEYVDDELRKVPSDAKGEDYTSFDSSLYLSGGYFLLNRLELGLSGSVMTTWYSGTDTDDFGVYDGLLYAKYFFDNSSRLTPYVKLTGGWSRISSGDYTEVDTKGAVVLGVEFFGMGPMTWYTELTSEYTDLSGDLGGAEWENRIYLGVTFYLDVLKTKKASVPIQPAVLTKETLETLMESENRFLESLQRLDERVYRDMTQGAAP